MERFAGIIVYFLIAIFVGYVRSKAKKTHLESSSMPHKHTAPGQYQTYNVKRRDNSTGAQPHAHEVKKTRSMSDASKLPPGYILLNGEPVRVADLEGK